MYRIVALIIAGLFTGVAVAAEYGVGISAKSDNGLVYLPIDVSPKFRVEPYLRHMSSDTKQVTDFGGGATTFKSESDSVEGGVGIFGLAVPKESVRLYYGGRASYFDGDSHSSSNTGQTRQSFTDTGLCRRSDSNTCSIVTSRWAVRSVTSLRAATSTHCFRRTQNPKATKAERKAS
jgi:hypothetical protein